MVKLLVGDEISLLMKNLGGFSERFNYLGKF